MTFLIDTNILIDHLRGDEKATEFLLDVETGRVKGCISVLTEYELLCVPHLQANQARKIEHLLGLLPKLAITSRVARVAAEIHRRYQTDIADALIAATARIRSAVLVTQNVKDFRPIKGLRLHTL